MVMLFFHKPLFGAEYTFPWDFRSVQLPLITFLRDELRENRFALWNPYNYGGYPVYANIQACFFHPLVLASAFLSSRFDWFSLPMLLEWAVALQVWLGGVAAYYLFQALGLGSAPAWTGAVMFETGSYFASRAEHIDSIMAAAWMPLAWLAVWKLRENLRMDWLAVLAAIGQTENAIGVLGMNADANLLRQEWKQLSPHDGLVAEHPDYSKQQQKAEQCGGSMATCHKCENRQQ